MIGSRQAEFNEVKKFEWNGLAYIIGKHWFNIFLLFVGLHIFISKDISFQFNVHSKEGKPNEKISLLKDEVQLTNTSIINGMPSSYEKKGIPKKKKKTISKEKKAAAFGNLTFILSPNYAKRKGIDPDVVKEKINHCKDYIERYAKVAINEREKYGIPASITLAQGLLESNVGDSRLSVESNNHFGIKCKRKCKGCTCRNYVDDDVYDMFRVFNTVWESYREHSILLNGQRYKHLLKLDHLDFKAWAHGLKRAGYATDKKYAQKLIKIIETMKLYRYDQ